MNDILIRSLTAAAGGVLGFLAAMWQGRLGGDKYLRKALLEVGGAALAGAFLNISTLLIQVALSFLAGVAWSLLCQGGRWLLTKRIGRTSRSLEAWLKSGGVPAETPRQHRKLAVRWPSGIWAKILHGIGLTNLSDGQITAYQTYRAQVAWDIHFSAEKERRNTDQADRFQNWRAWIPERAVLLISIAVVGIVVYSLVLFFEPDAASRPQADTSAQAATSLVQAFVILLLFLCIPDPLVDPYKSPDESEATRFFYRYWCAAQASWVAYYLIRFGTAMKPHRDWEIALLFGDNLNSVFAVVCYFVLHDPPYTSSQKEPISIRVPAIGMAIVGALTVAQTLCDRSGWNSHLVYFNWISGCAGGVTLALLVGRLQSKLLNPPVPFLVIALLYFYVVIQGSLGDFGAPPVLTRFSYFLALGLKCLLILLIARLVESGQLLAYMTQERIRQEYEPGTQREVRRRWGVDSLP